MSTRQSPRKQIEPTRKQIEPFPVELLPPDSTHLGKRSQPEPPEEEDLAQWAKLGQAMNAYKRAKCQFRLAVEKVHEVAKLLPVKVYIRELSALSSDDE